MSYFCAIPLASLGLYSCWTPPHKERGFRVAFCENCGAQLSDAAKFCSSCGKPARAGAATTPSNPSRPSSAIMKWSVAGAAFLTLLGAGALLYYSHRASNNAQDITQSIPDVGPIVKALDSPPSQPTAGRSPLPHRFSTQTRPLLPSKANARSSAKQSSRGYSEPTSLARTPTRQVVLIKEMDHVSLCGRKRCGRAGAN